MAKEIASARGVVVPKFVGQSKAYGVAAAKFGVVGALGLLLANCASQPQHAGYSSQQSREFGAFASRKYGTASPRVYGDTGAAMPKGGGRDHVGKAYQVAGKRYVPHDRAVGSTQVGMASWYGAAFHGRKTANGEIYDRRSFTAAHPTMPLPSYARVTNMRNGHSVIVRVNDRGPFHGGRIMDVSERVADSLAFKASGTGRVKVDYLGRAGLGGSDDVRLAQTLTMDGRPAVAEYLPASYGETRTVQVAAATQVAPVQAVASAPPAPVATFSARPAAPVAVAAPVIVTAPVIAPAKTVAAPAAKPAPVRDDVAEEKTEKPALSPAAAAAKSVSQSISQVPVRAPLPPSRPTKLGGKPAGDGGKPQKTASLSMAPAAVTDKPRRAN